MSRTIEKYTLGARIEATFTPTVTDNLDSPQFVGQRLLLQCFGTMDDGRYKGQTIWMPPLDSPVRMGWIPFEDLAGRH